MAGRSIWPIWAELRSVGFHEALRKISTDLLKGIVRLSTARGPPPILGTGTPSQGRSGSPTPGLHSHGPAPPTDCSLLARCPRPGPGRPLTARIVPSGRTPSPTVSGRSAAIRPRWCAPTPFPSDALKCRRSRRRTTCFRRRPCWCPIPVGGGGATWRTALGFTPAVEVDLWAHGPRWRPAIMWVMTRLPALGRRRGAASTPPPGPLVVTRHGRAERCATRRRRYLSPSDLPGPAAGSGVWGTDARARIRDGDRRSRRGGGHDGPQMAGGGWPTRRRCGGLVPDMAAIRRPCPRTGYIHSR